VVQLCEVRGHGICGRKRGSIDGLGSRESASTTFSEEFGRGFFVGGTLLSSAQGGFDPCSQKVRICWLFEGQV